MRRCPLLHWAFRVMAKTMLIILRRTGSDTVYHLFLGLSSRECRPLSDRLCVKINNRQELDSTPFFKNKTKSEKLSQVGEIFLNSAGLKELLSEY
jgi:hypothetical protein